MQNDATSTRKRNLIIIGIVVMVLFLFLAVALSSRKKTTSQVTITPENNLSESTIVDKEWGIQFPITKVGSLSTNLESSQFETTFIVPSTGARVQQRYVIVRGLTEEDNLCTLPYAASAIYRHKEENPGIDYSTAFNLNTVQTKKVKVGDWWYSTSSIITDGECFPDNVAKSKDYLNLANQYFNDFSKMKQYTY